METSLLIRESSLYKLNAQLELKAQELFKEADNLRTQESRPEVNNARDSSRSSSSDSSCTASARTVCRSVEQGLSGSPAKPASKACDGDQDRDEGTGIGRQTAMHIAQAKCQMLEVENEKMKLEMKKSSEKIKKTHEELEKMRESKTKCQKQAESNQKIIYKQQDQLQDLMENLRMKEAENIALRKEVDAVNRNLKKFTQESSNSTLRLNRCLEEIDRLKEAAKKAKCEVEEKQDSNRIANEQLTSTVYCLEKQKAELLTGLKKQMQLIDNLKQQLMHLETSKFVTYAEEEFSRCLDSKMAENSATSQQS